MLKHKSLRSESRSSYASDDFMVKLTALNTSIDNENTFDASVDSISLEIPEVYKTASRRNNSFSSLLPKPTIRNIIERRRSDLLFPDKEDNSLSGSIHGTDVKEILEEVEKDNSKLVIHRRKTNQLNYPSIEIDTVSKEEGDDKESIKDYWKTSPIPSPPLAFSSPVQSPIKTSSNKQANKGVEAVNTRNSNSLVKQKHDSKQYLHPQTLNTDALQSTVLSKQLTRSMPRKTTARTAEGCWIPNDSEQHNGHVSPRSNYGRGKDQLDSVSISAGSSVSNLKHSRAASSMCSCGTLSRRDLLGKITEEMEIEHKNFSITYDKKRKVVRYVKFLTIFLTILALIVCTVAGFLHFYIGFITQKLTLNQGDVRIIKKSSLFCGGINGYSEQSGVRIITFYNSQIRKTLQYTRSENIYLLPSTVWKREFYLMKNSILYIEIESEDSFDVLTFIGERNFSIWKQRQESDTFSKKITCCRETKEKKKTFFMTADRDEKYFIAVKSNELLASNIKVKLKFDRKSYDFSKTVSSCTVKMKEDCVVDYEFNTESDIAIEVPLQNSPNSISKSTTVQWKCEARVWFYFVLFLGVFYLVFILVLINYFVITRYIIPSNKCICIQDSQRNVNADSVEYYDNYGKANSETDGNENHSYMHKRSDNRSHIAMKPMYGDEVSRLSDTSNFLTMLFDTQSSIGTFNRSKIHSIRDQNSNVGTLSSMQKPSSVGVAALYNDEIPVEQADSGISVDPGFNPSGQQRLDAHELMYLQELQFQRLKYLRNQQQNGALIDGPSVKHILRRPASAIETSSSSSTPRSKQLVKHHGKRPQSVQSERHYSQNQNKPLHLMKKKVDRGHEGYL